MSERVPVTVVTGFLGAGKSTLVARWLDELPGAALIVNERGEVGIDGALLAGRASRLREITGGCVCCATAQELSLALAELAAVRPPRVLVETSGAASPAGVVRALTRGRAAEAMRLDGIVTVLDASRVARVLDFALAQEQLAFADVVVLSHVDRVDASGLARATELAGRHAPVAAIAHAAKGAVDGSLLVLLAARAEALRILPEGARHAGIDAVSLVYEGELDEARFGDWVEAALGEAEARILRVKGILAMRGIEERVVLQGVGEAIEVSLGAPWADAPRRSRLVVLGLGLDLAALEAGFARCAVRSSA